MRVAIGAICVIVLAGVVVSVWPNNAAALRGAQGIRQVSGSGAPLGCPVGSATEWLGEVPEGLPPYWQAAASASGAPGIQMPPLESWSRNERLWHWFAAQSLIRRGAYEESLSHLKDAHAAMLIDATTHEFYWRRDYMCFLFGRLLASEVGDTPLLDEHTAFVMFLIRSGEGETVAQAYGRALLFQPARLDWQQMVGQARRGA